MYKRLITLKWLRKNEACPEGIDFYKKLSKKLTDEEIIEKCYQDDRERSMRIISMFSYTNWIFLELSTKLTHDKRTELSDYAKQLVKYQRLSSHGKYLKNNRRMSAYQCLKLLTELENTDLIRHKFLDLVSFSLKLLREQRRSKK